MPLLRFLIRLRDRFYDGPRLLNYPGRRIPGYTSPTYWWIHAFSQGFLTVPGRLLLLMTGIFTLAAATTLIMPMYYLAFALVSLFLLDAVGSFFTRPRLQVQRRLPGSAPAGTPFRVEYQLRNASRQPAWELQVETLPLPKQVSFHSPPPSIDVLAAAGELRVHCQLAVARRGRYDFYLPLVDSAFPFGLVRWGSTGPPNQPLLVHPHYTPLHSLDLPPGRSFAEEGNVAAGNPRASLEFLGCREYRYGDSPRHLHAPSTARRGSPVVKEFRDEQEARTTVLLDNAVPPRPRWLHLVQPRLAAYEASLSLAAALAEHLDRRHGQVDLGVLGEGQMYVEGARGRAQLREILDLLAGLEPEERHDVATPPDHFLAELQQIGVVLLVLQRWDDSRAGLVQMLRASGVGLRCFVVADHLPQPPDDPSCTVVRPALIEEGEVTAL